MVSDFAALQLQIRVFCALITKLSGQDREKRLDEQFPGMTGLDAGVLLTLSFQSMTLRELSNQMMLTPATLVPVIDRLEESGWVNRIQDKQDRRRNNLSLTEAGQGVAAQIPAIDTQERLLESVQALGKDNSRQLADLLEELLRGMTTDPYMVDTVLQHLSQGGKREEIENGQ